MEQRIDRLPAGGRRLRRPVPPGAPGRPARRRERLPDRSALPRSRLASILPELSRNRENEAEMADPAHRPREDDGRICDMGTRREATIEDLYNVAEDGKAEIVNGEIVVMGPVAYPHGHASMEIVLSLREYGRRTKLGRAIPDPVAFIVNLPNRRSFCPDAAFHVGPSFGRKFIDGAPVFAVEVRSDGVYGAADPLTPAVYHRGEYAEAEPAVPGWSMAVDDLFLTA